MRNKYCGNSVLIWNIMFHVRKKIDKTTFNELITFDIKSNDLYNYINNAYYNSGYR
jgi:hypothetical protein